MRKIHWLLLLCLAGCKLGQVSPPPALPTGAVTGEVVSGGPLAGATVLIEDNGKSVASTRTDDDGRFALNLHVPSGIVTVHTDGIVRFNQTSGQEIMTGPLDARVDYEQGETDTITVSPFSTAAAAFANALVARGINPVRALREADADFAKWLGANPASAPAPLPTSSPLTPQSALALALKGLTSWAHKNGQNTGALTALMVQDLSYDGLLDGLAAGGPLRLGTTALSANVYRQNLAKGVLRVATAAHLIGSAHPKLTTEIVADAKRLAASSSAIFGGVHASPFGGAPIAVQLAPSSPWVHGALTLAGNVADPLGLPVTLTLTVGSQSTQTISSGQFNFTVATNDFSDGQYDMTVTAADAAGDAGKAHTVVGFDNAGPSACYRPSSIFVQVTTGDWSDISGIVSARFEGTPAVVQSNGTWEAQSGSYFEIAPHTLTLTDGAGNVRTFTWTGNEGICK